MSNKKWSVIVLVAIVLSSVVTGYLHKSAQPTGFTGALGNNYIERYSSEIQYNGGYNSQLPIKTSSTITGGDLNIPTIDTATSTTIVGCVQTTATSTASPIVLQFSSNGNATSTFSGLSNGIVSWAFGTCPAITQ